MIILLGICTPCKKVVKYVTMENAVKHETRENKCFQKYVEKDVPKVIMRERTHV